MADWRRTTVLIKRSLTAAIAIPIVVGAIYLGPEVFTGLVTLAVIGLVLEFARISESAGARPLMPVLMVYAVAMPVILRFMGSVPAVLWMILLFGTVMAAKILDYEKATLGRLGATILGFLYVGFLPAMLTLTYSEHLGPLPLLMVFISVWVADSSAYAVGMLFGRTPLAPALSPKKSVEGAVGSIVVSAAVIGLLWFWSDLTVFERALFGGAVALAAIFGDLFESALKREAGVKDSGAVLPGHGGLLDRVDSLLAVAPLSYFLLLIWLG